MWQLGNDRDDERLHQRDDDAAEAENRDDGVAGYGWGRLHRRGRDGCGQGNSSKELQKEKIGRMCTVHIGRRTAQRGHCGQSRWKGSGLSDEDRTVAGVEYELMLLSRYHALSWQRGQQTLDRSAYLILARLELDRLMSLKELAEAFPPRHLHGQPSGGGARATRTGRTHRRSGRRCGAQDSSHGDRPGAPASRS